MKWSLATQLRLGFGVAFILALGVAAAAWWIAVNHDREITGAYDTQLRTTVQLAEAQSAYWQLRFGLRQFMVAGPDGQQRLLEQQGDWYAIIEERLAAYDKAASSTDERRTLTGLRSAYQRYKQARPKFLELWQAGEKDEATAWLALTIEPFGAQAGRAFETQISLQRSFVERFRERSQRNARLGLALVTAITIVLLGMLVIGYVAAMRMLRPLRALRAHALDIVREQFGGTIDAPTSNNEVTALVKSFQFMSERLLAHTDSLRRSNERLDFLLSATPAVIWSSRAEGDYARTFVSENVREILGYAPEEFVADPRFWVNHIHSEDRPAVLGQLPREIEGNKFAHEYRFRHADGTWRWVRADATVVRDATGRPEQIVGYWIDVTERVQAEEERNRARARLRLALEAGRLAVWDADTASGGVWLSEQWAEILGEAKRETWTTLEELLARTHPDDRQPLRGALVAVLKGERAEYVEDHRVRAAGGEWRWIQLRGGVTARTADGRAARLSGTALDITQRKRLETEIELASRMKSEFMASVTHELRTPLNSVIGFAELLKDGVAGALNAEQAQFAADILAGGQHLRALVEAILEMSRLDAASAALERKPVEIGPALEERMASRRKAAAARDVTLKLDVAPDVGRAQLDPKALRRILDALLDNAIKFNRDGGTVAVRARRQGDWLEIAVADDGIGIAHEDLARLFKPLVQLDAGLARRHDGIGLGLALARRHAELHGGTIEVRSEKGKGSIFTVRLQLEPTEGRT